MAELADALVSRTSAPRACGCDSRLRHQKLNTGMAELADAQVPDTCVLGRGREGFETPSGTNLGGKQMAADIEAWMEWMEMARGEYGSA